MGEHSKIEWTDHTFNPWWGCVRVSPGCEHCYAETFAKRVGQKVWGVDAPRRMMSDAYWRAPIKWNCDAEREGVRRRVFCASMADVFEDRPELSAPRARLYRLIHDTPALDWLLLTKRPENAERLWTVASGSQHMVVPAARDVWRDNVWLGTTVEDQARANQRLDRLCGVPAVVRFVSAEPLLGAVDLRRWLRMWCGIDWVIAGGESGPGARPLHPAWARSLRDQCESAGVPFLWKQWGEWAPDCLCGGEKACRETPRPTPGPVGVMFRCGKAAAGRKLDGRTHDDAPRGEERRR